MPLILTGLITTSLLLIYGTTNWKYKSLVLIYCHLILQTVKNVAMQDLVNYERVAIKWLTHERQNIGYTIHRSTLIHL